MCVHRPFRCGVECRLAGRKLRPSGRKAPVAPSDGWSVRACGGGDGFAGGRQTNEEPRPYTHTHSRYTHTHLLTIDSRRPKGWRTFAAKGVGATHSVKNPPFPHILQTWTKWVYLSALGLVCPAMWRHTQNMLSGNNLSFWFFFSPHFSLATKLDFTPCVIGYIRLGVYVCLLAETKSRLKPLTCFRKGKEKNKLSVLVRFSVEWTSACRTTPICLCVCARARANENDSIITCSLFSASLFSLSRYNDSQDIWARKKKQGGKMGMGRIIIIRTTRLEKEKQHI